MEARVVRISIAPVKSLELVHPDEVELEQRGRRGDRRFWLVDADGRLFNGKRFGQIMRIPPEWDEATRELALDVPGRSSASTASSSPASRSIAMMYRHPHPSRRVLGPWEAAISDFAGEPLTLLWPDVHAVDRGYRGGCVSLVSRASLERLREEAGAGGAVDGRRFRMLFEIDGVGAHEEDEWLGTQVRDRRGHDRAARRRRPLRRDDARPRHRRHRPRHARHARELPPRGPERAASVRRLRRRRRAGPRAGRRCRSAPSGPLAAT